MLKKYRRNFIVLNVGTIGLTLLIVLLLLGINIYQREYAELKDVMKLVLKPYNFQMSEFHSPDNKTNKDAARPDDDKNTPREEKNSMSSTAPEDENQQSAGNPAPNPHSPQNSSPPEPKGNNDLELRKNDNITTIFYNKKTDTISLLSENISYSGDTDEIVKAIAQSNDSFGTLQEYHVIYYKENTENEYKIALTDVSYITSKMIPVIILLLLGFILALLLLLLASFRLSSVAAAPMEKAIEMERQFVADISHDLKTPITVILANNSILKADPEASVAEQLQWINSTDTAAKDMMNLISEMLTLSSLEEMDKTVERERIDLSSVLQKCVLQLESVAYEQEILMEDDIPDDLFILASEEYTKRICSGLIDNAIKYEPKKGKIIITAQKQKKHVTFSVRNTGSVIEKDDLPHIFDRFYRGDKTRNSQKGHGLGLPIIKRMTELIGAQIIAESSAENGTEFIVSFEASV